MTAQRTASKPAKPSKVFRAGRLELAVWESLEDAKGGGKYTKHSIVLTKSWKDAAGNWNQAKLPMFLADLPEIVCLLQVAWARLAVKTDKDK